MLSLPFNVYLNPMKKILFFVCVLLPLFSLNAQIPTDSLTQLLTEIQQNSILPGYAVAIVNPEKVLYQQGFGFADLDAQTPYTPQTIQNIGSISKTFIGVAIMQLVEQGKLSLDAKINDLLPFKVVNPWHPEGHITVKQLCTHTSGITDTPVYNTKGYVLKEKIPEDKTGFSKAEKMYLKKIKGNKERPLGDFLAAYLSPSGRLYKKKNFQKSIPGSTYRYTNIGSALAAYLVEVLTGKPYYEYVKDQILTPLNMQASGLKLEEVELEKHAALYSLEGAVLPRYTLITYPDGGMLTNCEDLAGYLQQMMAGYVGKSDLMTAASFQEMMKVQFAEEKERSGIFWDISKTDRIGHNGGDPGIFTYIQFDPTSRVGYVFMTNCAAYEDEQGLKSFIAIWSALKEYGAKF